MLVTVCGNLCTGKTTLLKLVKTVKPNTVVHIEKPSQNPYLEKIEDYESALFPCEMYFLMRCVDAYESARDSSRLVFVERSLEEQAMFARKLLKGSDRKLFDDVFNFILRKIDVSPNGTIFLCANLETIRRNMKRRNDPIHDNRRIASYPVLFSSEYDRFHKRIANEKTCLIIDTNKYDITENTSHKAYVVALVEEFINRLKSHMINER